MKYTIKIYKRYENGQTAYDKIEANTEDYTNSMYKAVRNLAIEELKNNIIVDYEITLIEKGE